MRPPVPFIGEELIFRDEDDQGDGKRRGQIIDDVLSTAGEPSSWEDSLTEPRATRHASARITKSTQPVRPGKHALPKDNLPARIDWKSINNGQGLQINISGTIDQALHEEWLRLLRDIASQNIDQFEFNLTKASTVKLTGLAMLLLFREKMRLQRQNIKLCHCNSQILELLQWTGMDRYFEIQDTMSAADSPNKKAKPE